MSARQTGTTSRRVGSHLRFVASRSRPLLLADRRRTRTAGEAARRRLPTRLQVHRRPRRVRRRRVVLPLAAGGRGRREGAADRALFADKSAPPATRMRTARHTSAVVQSAAGVAGRVCTRRVSRLRRPLRRYSALDAHASFMRHFY